MRPEIFTPVSALVGGILIGIAASLFLLVNGRVAGISGLLAGVVSPGPSRRGVASVFLLGLLLVGLVASVVAPERLPPSPSGLPVLAVAGLLVGFGTRLGGGCTSGHGVCGISRGSVRSIVATVTFMAVALLVVAGSRAWGAFP